MADSEETDKKEGQAELERKIKKLSGELKQKRASCMRYCPCWNVYDQDCDIYGSMHVPPSRCLFYLKQEVMS